MRTSYFPLWLCGLALAIGCGPAETPDSADFGRFEGDVVASWDADGRNMTLREDLVYVDPQNRRWTAPSGSVVNGASIPAAFWTFVGGPFEGKYRTASVVHDVGCVEMTASWEDVHRMFYEACRCGGVDESTAKTLYYAVYHFGPRWQPVTETRVVVRENADGQLVEQEVTTQRMVRLDPPPPTLEEVEQVEALVVEENPEPSEIEQTTREVLRHRPRRGRGHGRPADGVGGPPSSAARFDRTVWQRPEGVAVGPGSGRIRGHGAEESGMPGGRPDWRENGHPGRGGPRDQRPAEEQPAPDLPAVTPDEQQWATEQVRQYLEQQTGEQRPAEYGVERTEDGYRVLVQYLQLDEQGQPTGEGVGSSTVRLSRDGQVLEMISGM